MPTTIPTPGARSRLLAALRRGTPDAAHAGHRWWRVAAAYAALRRVPLAGALAAALAATAPAAPAQEVTLRIHHPLPPPSTAHSKFLLPWTQKIERECPGRVKFQVFPAMQLGGTPVQLYDQAKDGVVDLIWTVLGYSPGRFHALEAFELPFMTRTAQGSSRALWEYAQANGVFAGELKDVHALALHVHDEGVIHTTARPVRTLADFRGLKLRGPTRLTTKMLQAFGATPVGLPVTQVADAMSKGLIDGAIVPWEIVPAIKLHELARFHSETDPKARALYTATFVFAMNRASYGKLPADVKRCIDANSGAELSAWIGKIWDESSVAARKLAVDRGNTFHTVPAAELAQWEKAAAGVQDEWSKEAASKGLVPAALLKSARETIQKYDAN
ncbi:MAG: TRAP transporter substrate-binding protein [Burkholderiaceae bacterium]